MGNTENILKQVLEDTSPDKETMGVGTSAPRRNPEGCRALSWGITHIPIGVSRPPNCEW